MDTPFLLENVTYDFYELETLTSLLEDAVRDILHNNTDYDAFEQLYYTIYSLVVTNFGHDIFLKVQTILQTYLREQIEANLQYLTYCPFLEALVHLWESYCESMIKIKYVFLYLDNILKSYSPHHSLDTLHMNVFKEEVFGHPEISDKQNRYMLHLVEEDRKGHFNNRKTLRDLCRILMLVNLGERDLYEYIFENALMETTLKKYCHESLTFLATQGIMDYIENVHSILRDEIERAQSCFDPSTMALLIDTLELTLIKDRLSILVLNENSLLKKLLQQEQLLLVQRLCQLLQRIPEGIGLVMECVGDYLVNRGRDVISEFDTNIPVNSSTTSTVMQKLQEFFNCAERIVEYTFPDNDSITHITEIKFKHVLNELPKIAEHLSSHLHTILRKKSQERDFEEEFSDWLVFFNYLDTKDLFEFYYRLHLAKRLLVNKPGDHDLRETNVVNKLREECGFLYTCKMMGMLKDVEMYTNLNETFNQIQSNKTISFEMTVQVLTPTCWPIDQSPIECVLPAQVEHAFQQFNKFYSCEYEHRELVLLPQLGDVELLMCFDHHETNQYTLLIGTLHMIILMLFNLKHCLTYEEIQEQTKIPTTKLHHTLQALTNDKHKILIKYPADANYFGPGNTFFFNNDFYYRKSRVKVRSRSAREHELQHEEQQEITVDRTYELQAAVIRVAKSLGHVQELRLILLVTEAVRHRFRSSPQDIKRVLPNLIERGYLKLSQDNRKVYEYVP